MKERRTISVVASIILTDGPFMVQAAQISPNPNTGTTTVNTFDAFNSLNPFDNTSVVNITETGSLFNNPGSRLNNACALTKLASSLYNPDTLTNTGSNSTLTNIENPLGEQGDRQGFPTRKTQQRDGKEGAQ